MLADVGLTLRLLASMVLLALVGCSSNKANQPLNATEERLLKLGTAYVSAANRLGRAPDNFEEIKPDLERELPDDFLRSPNDGEPFVIIWGVDYNKLPPRGRDPYTVGAYEKQGVDGKRYVLRFPMGVRLLTEEEFRNSVFPPGHKPSG